MKKLFVLFLSLIVSCISKEEVPGPPLPEEDTAVYHDMIVLGEKLDDPYSIDNMRKALARVCPSRAERVDLKETDLYVRFLPETGDDYERLSGLGIPLVDHPVDYRILREGDWYHDPAIPEDRFTWQYSVVPADFSFPAGIAYELLDKCYIAANDTRSGSDGIDWDEVEREAFRLTGNASMLVPSTRAGTVGGPSGRITIEDPLFAGGKPFGVAGVEVFCNTFVKCGYAHTDRDGYYSISKVFSSEPRYRLVFDNSRGFSIGLNLVLIPGSVSALGKGDVAGIDVHVGPESDRSLFRRCAVNNAAYDYISRCTAEDMGITPPPSNLRFWIIPGLRAGSAPMLHHGAVMGLDLVNEYLGDYSKIVTWFLPDITVGITSEDDYASVYASICHEMSHASHYSQVGNDFWNRYVKYVITSFVKTGGTIYGTGEGTDAGYCEVGEMWAYFNEAKMIRERYGGVSPDLGTTFWFRPQIFTSLDERGVNRGKIFRALGDDVCSRATLQDRLNRLYPADRSVIDQIFERYGL